MVTLGFGSKVRTWHSSASSLPSISISNAVQIACIAATSIAADDDTPLQEGYDNYDAILMGADERLNE